MKLAIGVGTNNMAYQVIRELPSHLKSVYFRKKMIYGYIRVSSDKQTVENQRFEI